MPLIQVFLSEELDRKIDVYRAQHGLTSKADAILAILEGAQS